MPYFRPKTLSPSATYRSLPGWAIYRDVAVLSTAIERGALSLSKEIRPPFHCDYGYNIRIGLGVFFNFNSVSLDVVAVTVGARTQIGPAVQIYTADHPCDPSVRRTGAEFGRPSGSVRMCGSAAVRSFCRA
jgi:acetyltransferase-like isoleucine patch superfamily enzyme